MVDSPAEEDGFELAVPPRRERLWAATPGKHCRFGPQPVSGSTFHAAVLASSEGPFAGAGPMVRIRFPPAESLQTFGSRSRRPADYRGDRLRGQDFRRCRARASGTGSLAKPSGICVNRSCATGSAISSISPLRTWVSYRSRILPGRLGSTSAAPPLQ